MSVLVEYARDAHPLECCGLLLGTRKEVSAVKLTANVAAQPASSFEIDPLQLIAAQKAERQGDAALVGYFHSHPSGKAKPSETDAEMALPDGRIWLIISGENITAWRAQENGVLHDRFCPLTIDITG